MTIAMFALGSVAVMGVIVWLCHLQAKRATNKFEAKGPFSKKEAWAYIEKSSKLQYLEAELCVALLELKAEIAALKENK